MFFKTLRIFMFPLLLSPVMVHESEALTSGQTAFLPSPSGNEPIQPEFIATPPTIDGVIDEEFWKSSPRVTGFITFLPDFDITPKEQTEVSLAYDKENLYFAFRCYDEPDKIKASIAGRDKIFQDDFICINLDSFNDQQGLTAFYVNPLGIQGDSRYAAGNEDFSPDFVWYSAGKLDSTGYSVEVQLPLKSLRYRNDDPTTMGVILERYISRRSEHSTYPRMDPAKGFAIQTQMYPITYRGIEHYKLFEILPSVTVTRQEARTGASLEQTKQEADASLTAKYGITSDLIFDATLNPDFSQVESDAGQVDVNLRYSLFYPEKRPFFLEGQDNFNIGANTNVFDPTIYYSRTIADPLLGTKLTGKVGAQNTIAALYALDNVLESDRIVFGRYVHVPVVRYKRTLSDDSYAGVLFAGRELEGSSNRVMGFDEQYRISDAAVVESNGFLSWAKDGPGASVLAGNTLGARFFSNNRSLTYSVSARHVSDDFRADMGYVTRTALLNFVGYLNPRIYPESQFFQRIGFEFTESQTKDRPSGLWESSHDAATNIFFAGNWLFRVRVNNSTEVFERETFQTSGAHVQVRGQVTKQISFMLLGRRIRSIHYPTASQGKSNILNATLTLQPWETFLTEGSFAFTDFYTDATDEKLYEGTITRLKMTYQPNQYLSFRAIGEYNEFRNSLVTDFLASFLYIPGTAVYLGYGGIFEKRAWDGMTFVESSNFLEMRRGFFMKMSYLWRS